MITIEQACEIVLKEDNARYVFSVKDVGRGYVISDGDVLETTATSPLIVDKVTGEIGAYFIPDHFDELDVATKLPVPERFQCPDAVYKDGFIVDD